MRGRLFPRVYEKSIGTVSAKLVEAVRRVQFQRCKISLVSSESQFSHAMSRLVRNILAVTRR